MKTLKKQILEGNSMQVCGDKFLTSSIVGGIAPIGLGIALAKCFSQDKKGIVWVFVGDGAYHCGVVQECIRYASGFNLPIVFVLENNGLQVRANTKETWGFEEKIKVHKYNYKRKYPHAGSGNYVMF